MNKKYHILTLGCQMNINDSERIETKLKEIGYQPASEKEAGLVIINACSVRQHAVDRIWGHFKKWADRDEKQILVTGCVLKNDRKTFEGKNVHFFEINKLDALDKILINKFNKEINDLKYFHIKPSRMGKIAYVPIMTGCDNYCSYCAVPYTRGREVSRAQDEIITEVKEAISLGYKEIMLLGQNVNSYNPSKKDRSQFDNSDYINLLKEVDALEGDFEFNFISSNPHDMSDELIECYSNLNKWPRQLHLAMQSGDDDILKKNEPEI